MTPADETLGAQPRCPECGTVLRDFPPGFSCAPCGLTFLRTQI